MLVIMQLSRVFIYLHSEFAAVFPFTMQNLLPVVIVNQLTESSSTVVMQLVKVEYRNASAIVFATVLILNALVNW